MSVDEEDGDVVREVAAEVPAADKPPGIQLHRLQILFILCGLWFCLAEREQEEETFKGKYTIHLYTVRHNYRTPWL